MLDPRSGRRENRRRARGKCFHACGLDEGHPLMHFDVPTAAGRRIFSVPCCGSDEEAMVSALRGTSQDQLAVARSDSGPVIVVFVNRDGKYFTDYGFSSQPSSHINELMLKVLSYLSRCEENPLQQPGVSSLKDLFHTASLEGLPKSSMWVRIFNNWGIRFYIRIDHGGNYHTYPNVGGQHTGGLFHSLPEAYSAIDGYLRDRQDPTMCIDPYDPDLITHVKKSTREKIIRRILYWPDGTRKVRLQSLPIDEIRCWMLQLVRALVDKYNDDHNLFGDLAYKLKDVVIYHVFNEGASRRMYYHINFTAETKDTKDLLFFAETMREQRDELVVSGICRVDPFDKDLGCCYGCSSEVKHPKDVAYIGGHSREQGTYNSYGPRKDLGVTAAQLEAEEAQVRYFYKDPTDPSLLRAPMEVNYPPPRPAEESLAFISKFFTPAASRRNPVPFQVL